MKMRNLMFVAASFVLLASCGGNEQAAAPANQATATAPTAGQSGVQDELSQKDVVKVAVSSPDHTTLVKAVQAAELVDALSNAGPFTVFAPTNAAFEKLPAGTVEELLKPENKAKLQDILQYHVSVGVYKTENMMDGQSLGQANGGNVKIAKAGDKFTVNGANIIASVPASNGIVHIVDAVLLPPAQ